MTLVTPPEPPQAVEAERAVLAAMFLDADAIARARVILSPESFYRTAHASIFAAILALADRTEPADLITVSAELRARGLLDAVGGPAALSGILEFATTTANLEAHARQVRIAWAQRRGLRAAARMPADFANGATPSAVLASIGSEISQIAAEVEPGARPPTLEEQMVDGERFMDPVERPPDLIGSGYIVAGGLTMFASQPGHGKTYLALQMMRSLALGTPWLDFEARAGTRSIMVQFETPRYSLQERFARARDAASLCSWLIMPQGWGFLASHLDELAAIVEKRKAQLVTFDPLHNLAPAINFDEDVSPMLNAVHKLRNRTGVSVMLLHHVNRIEFDKDSGLRTNVLRAVKGSGRLTGDPDTVIGLVERRGRLLLVNAKTRLGPSEESIAIRQGADGWFERVATPAEVSEGSDSKLLGCLRVYGASGATLDQICEECEMSPPTARKHLVQLGAVRIRAHDGRGAVVRWYLPENSPQGELVEGPIEPGSEW